MWSIDGVIYPDIPFHASTVKMKQRRKNRETFYPLFFFKCKMKYLNESFIFVPNFKVKVKHIFSLEFFLLFRKRSNRKIKTIQSILIAYVELLSYSILTWQCSVTCRYSILLNRLKENPNWQNKRTVTMILCCLNNEINVNLI